MCRGGLAKWAHAAGSKAEQVTGADADKKHQPIVRCQYGAQTCQREGQGVSSKHKKSKVGLDLATSLANAAGSTSS